MPPNGNARQTVAILGAGPAGLSAAFALAETGKYKIHVYQMGWRAGGKCATGRDLEHHRALQNGSHYLFGSYHNAFHLIRRAHEVIAASSDPEKHKFGKFETDFVARNLLVGKQTYRRGSSGKLEEGHDWYRYMPQNMATPGKGGKFPTPFDLGLTMLQFAIGTGIDFLYAGMFPNAASDRFEGVRLCLKALPLCPFDLGLRARLTRTLIWPFRFVTNTAISTMLGLTKGLMFLAELAVPASWLRRARSAWRKAWKRLVAALRVGSLKCVKRALKRGPAMSRRIQRLYILFDLALTIVVGYYADRLNEPGGLERIDDIDFRKWLRKHRASRWAVKSALVTTWYDAVIAYEDGDEANARCSAAVALNAILRSLAGYKGAFAFQMHAEVGDSYIAPIVKALEILEVKFHFYSRVKQIVVGDTEPVVEKLVIGVQCDEPPSQAEFIEVTDHAKPKKPKPRLAWPAVPLSGTPSDPPLDSYYSTVERYERTLHKREDFDSVIAALPIGVMCDVLVRNDGNSVGAHVKVWQDCFTHVKVTESQALRMWFKVPLTPSKAPNDRSLGWKHDPPILSGHRWPHSTWEDNSQAVYIHKFPADQHPQTIATLFGALRFTASEARDPDHHKRQLERARADAEKFALLRMLSLWKGLESGQPGQIDWDAFVDPSEATGPNRFNWQHVAANVGPIESYVLALPGSLKHRLRPDESGYRNLYLAGDWTRNGVEVGTVEGAVISGLKAARAVSGVPASIIGGDDFDRGTLFEAATPA